MAKSKKGRKGAVHVKGYSYVRKGKRIRVPGYNRRRAKK